MIKFTNPICANTLRDESDSCRVPLPKDLARFEEFQDGSREVSPVISNVALKNSHVYPSELGD